MIINICINCCHILLIMFLSGSIFINNCIYKLYSLFFISFILMHYITKYGKCGIINIEKFFLGTEFKNGVAYRLIKPVISYKNNTFYDCGGMYILAMYILILIYQIYINRNSCINTLKLVYNHLIKKKPTHVVPQINQTNVKNNTVQSNAVQSNTLPSNIVQSNVVQSNVVQPNVVQPKIVQSNTVQPNTVQPNIVQSNTVQPNTVQPNIVQPNVVQPYNVEQYNLNPSTVIQPQVIQPQVIQPQVIQPQVMDSSVMQPTIMPPP